MQTLTHPTVAGTISLLFAFPYLAPGPPIDVSGSTVFTSRFASAPRRPRLFEHSQDEYQWMLLSRLLIEHKISDLTPQQQFEALISFGEQLVEKIYDLPSDFAAVISAKLPELL